MEKTFVSKAKVQRDVFTYCFEGKKFEILYNSQYQKELGLSQH